MKKFPLAVLALILILSPLTAQTVTIGPKVSFGSGVERGADWDNTLQLTSTSNKFSLTYAVGGTAVVQFTPLLGLQADFLYSRLSFKHGDDSDWTQYSWNILSVPIYVRFSHTLGHISAYALAGIGIDLFFGDLTISYSSGINLTTDIRDVFENSLYVSVAAGAGVTLPLSPGYFDLGLRYRTGLTDRYNGSDMFNQAILLDAAYRFNIK